MATMTIKERVAEWVVKVGYDEADALLCEFVGAKGSMAMVGRDGIIYSDWRGVRLTDTECAAFLAWVEARVVVFQVHEARTKDGRCVRRTAQDPRDISTRVVFPCDGDHRASTASVVVYEVFESSAPNLKQLNEIEEAKL